MGRGGEGYTEKYVHSERGRKTDGDQKERGGEEDEGERWKTHSLDEVQALCVIHPLNVSPVNTFPVGRVETSLFCTFSTILSIIYQ